MLARVTSATVLGVEALGVAVEVDVAFGLPGLTIVGLAGNAVLEARDRVRSAIRNSGFEIPARRITVNLAPADLAYGNITAMAKDVAVRFTVGDAGGPRSSVWRVWATPTKSDLYLSASAIAGHTKISFHESGDWRDAMIATPSKKSAPPLVRQAQPSGSRLLHQWDRPQNSAPGWSIAYHVIIPEPDVYGPVGPVDPRVVVRPRPAPGHAAYVSLLFAEASAADRDAIPEMEDTVVVPLAQFDLPNGDRVWLVTFDLPMTAATAAQYASWKASAQEIWDEETAGAPILDTTRNGSYGSMADGSRFVVDMALAVPPSAYRAA